MLSTVAIAKFLADRRARNCSPATIAFYVERLSRLARASIETPLTPDPLRDILASIEGAPASRHATYRALRALYRWLTEEEIIEKNPMLRVSAPRVPKLRQRTLDQLDVVQLLATPLSPRDLALITLILDTGIRAGEARTLRGRDIHDSWIEVTGKTGQRAVPAHPETINLLLALVRRRDDLVFHSRVGQPLTKSGIYQLAKRAIELADLRSPAKNGTHVLRHTFGRFWITEGGSLPSLQTILGHADIKTTIGYVNLAALDVSREHQSASKLTHKKQLLEVRQDHQELGNGDHHVPATKQGNRQSG